MSTIKTRGFITIAPDTTTRAPADLSAKILSDEALHLAGAHDILPGEERRMEYHKIWEEQCRATYEIKERFGIKSALDYLVGEKLLTFAHEANLDPEFAAELPRFQAAVWDIFNPYELAGYLASLKPSRRKKLQNLVYVRSASRSLRS